MIIKYIVDLFYNFIKSIVETLSPGSVLLDMKRSVQLDSFSCGVQCAFMILKYYGKAKSIENVKKELNLSKSDGVDTEPILALFRKRGLKVTVNEKAELSDIKTAIENNWPILISINDGDHWVVVYGYSENFIWILDPAIKRISCRIRVNKFRKLWDDNWIAIVK